MNQSVKAQSSEFFDIKIRNRIKNEINTMLDVNTIFERLDSSGHIKQMYSIIYSIFSQEYNFISKTLKTKMNQKNKTQSNDHKNLNDCICVNGNIFKRNFISILNHIIDDAWLEILSSNQISIPKQTDENIKTFEYPWSKTEENIVSKETKSIESTNRLTKTFRETSPSITRNTYQTDKSINLESYRYRDLRESDLVKSIGNISNGSQTAFYPDRSLCKTKSSSRPLTYKDPIFHSEFVYPTKGGRFLRGERRMYNLKERAPGPGNYDADKVKVVYPREKLGYFTKSPKKTIFDIKKNHPETILYPSSHFLSSRQHNK